MIDQSQEMDLKMRSGGCGIHLLAAFLWFAVVLEVGTFLLSTAIRRSLSSQYPAPGRLVDMGGYRMHLNCQGQGSPTVLLEAGLDDYSIFWSQVQPGVAEFTRVCAYDRAGYGWSEASPQPRTGRVMVEELHTLLSKSGERGPYVLVGHSYGGALVRLYAHEYPQETAGVVLVDGVHEELFRRVPGWRNPIEKKVALYRSLAPLGSFGLLAFTPHSIPNRGLPLDVLRQYRAIAVSTRYFQTGLAENQAFESNLREISQAQIDLDEIPLIVISEALWNPFLGLADVSEDKARQAQQAWQEMQAELPSLSRHGRQVIAEKSQHYIQFDQPDLVIEAIREMTGSLSR